VAGNNSYPDALPEFKEPTSWRPWRAGCIRFLNLFRKERLDRELDIELAIHLEMHIADSISAGMIPPKPAAKPS